MHKHFIVKSFQRIKMKNNIEKLKKKRKKQMTKRRLITRSIIYRNFLTSTEMKMKLENSEPLSRPLCWLTSMLEQEGDVDAEIEAFKIKLQMSQVSIVR